MALTPFDLTYPQGELTDAMFPDRQLEQNIFQWLGEKTGSDDAVRHWVYHRAYQAVANRLATEPSSVAYFSDVTRSIGADRVKFYQDAADKHLAAYDQLTESELSVALIAAKVRVF